MSDESFSLPWLAMREPVDHRSRAAELLPPLARWWRERGARRVLDLGSGTGSNPRYLAPRLPAGQEWTLLDHDPGLLESGAGLDGGSLARVARIERVRGDLAGEGLARIRHAELVTASALLDLVSQSWLDRLVDACLDSGSAALLSLSWDGSIEWGLRRTGARRAGEAHTATSPGGSAGDEGRAPDFGDAGDETDPDDALVLDAVRGHQERDKGLGGALGPRAGAAAELSFRRAGYSTLLVPSPWRLGAADAELARALVAGWERAASEQRPEYAERFRRWALRRRASMTAGVSLVVGHVDLLALPRASG